LVQNGFSGLLSGVFGWLGLTIRSFEVFFGTRCAPIARYADHEAEIPSATSGVQVTPGIGFTPGALPTAQLFAYWNKSTQYLA
jgi:hypothetical protein